MFRNRRTSQKPNDELYASFKQTFPGLGRATATSSAATSEGRTSLSDALTDPATHHRSFGELKDHDVTPRGQHEQWRFTPSLLDPGSFSFPAFANQPPGYYTPTPGGLNTLYHSQAGDLHTPNLGFQLGTPLSMPMSDSLAHAAPSFDMNVFQPQPFAPQPFQQQATFQPQQSFAPSSFVHQDSGYEAMEGSPEDDLEVNPDLLVEQHTIHVPTFDLESTMAAPPVPTHEKFRYTVTLNAPTAMIRHSEEIPVTYLNKGQAYSMTIVDNVPLAPSQIPTKYRTVVRISFEDEQQRLRPSACWQLWKEGRGLAEAHQRGGKLQAVEYVDPHPGGGDDNSRRPRVDLERASFDSFSVIWTPTAGTNVADCSVAVRFNFLSTDFSHSKGVKGIPVRLCAKTEIISSGTPDSPPLPEAEVCYCKVKLFRDHGAERKLSNDVAHVKKTIEKLKQQISQVESGIKDFGKRKRSGSIAGKTGGERPGKVQKHKRTWSVSSQSSTGRPAIEEDLHQKLATVQDMFTSTRPVSVLYLKGLEQDDPDLFPVALPGETQTQDPNKPQNISRTGSWERRRSAEVTPASSCIVSPVPSAQSIPSQPRSKEMVAFQQPIPFNPAQQLITTEWTTAVTLPGTEFASAAGTASQPIKIHRGNNGNDLPAWIEALGVDSSYQPPPERLAKPVACFYVLIKVRGNSPDDCYYRAVYLVERTLSNLIHNITAKCAVEATLVQRTLRINDKGLKIIVDDEVVRELPEGQDMTVEFDEMESPPTVKHDPGSFVMDHDAPDFTTIPLEPRRLEMKLFF